MSEIIKNAVETNDFLCSLINNMTAAVFVVDDQVRVQNINQSFTDLFERDENFTKQLLRHVILGIEILPSKNFTIRAGYNYQRRQELKFEEKLSTVGLSAGFGIKIKRFHFDFATTRFHLAGTSNLFSLSVNLNNELQ